MTRVPATVLLVAVALLTAFAATRTVSPLAWLLVYAGWLVLARHCGESVLDGLRREREEEASAPGRSGGRG